jgi:hypothetical protein
MPDEVSRVLGVDGMVVTGVDDHRWWIDFEVELVARTGCCRWCGRGSLEVKERDVVRVRDSPLPGRITYLCWRKRRLRYEACGGHATRPSGAALAAAGHGPVQRLAV